MARIIRFPLKMKNGAEVRSLDELKENFDLESVLGYFTDGKLRTWLADRYYDEKAEAVAALSKDMPDLNAKLCEILEVEYEAESDNTDLEEIQRKNEKYKMLSAVTGDREILDNIDLVVMNQDELYDILDTGSDKVYLYGERFEIPFGKKNISYIGVNEPLVLIDKTRFADDFEEAGIAFKNVRFEEGAYQKKKVYPEPVGEFEINNGILIKGKPDSKGICIIPYGVTRIAESAFNGLKTIRSVTIPDSVNSIGKEAFMYCNNITSLTISDGVSNIEEGAFMYLIWLQNLVIPGSVKSIDKNAFQSLGSNCNNPTNIIISEGVTSIGEGAFACCRNLTSITIPSSVKELGFGAFHFCEKLANIIFSNNEFDYRSFKDAFRATPWGEARGITHWG